MKINRLADHLTEVDRARLESGAIDEAQVGQHAPFGEGVEGRIASGVDLLHDLARALGKLAGVAAEDHVDVALDRGQGRFELVRGLPQVTGLLVVRTLDRIGQLDGTLFIGGPLPLEECGALALGIEQVRDDAHARGAEQAAVRVFALQQRRADFWLAGGIEDQVDLAVGGEFVEATVRATADPVLVCECHPRSGGVGVEHVADLDLREPDERLEDRVTASPCAHQGDDVGIASHCCLVVERPRL